MKEAAGELRFTPGRRFADMAGLVDTELGVSSWIAVDQTMIDRFADCTGDRQWIHVDVERCRNASPFGAPIAHGFLTLSLLPAMSYEIAAAPEGVAASFNYGLDKLRFLSPVKVGSRVRLRSRLIAFSEKAPGRFLMKTDQTVEIEGEQKPALIAEALTMLVSADTDG